MKPSTPKRRWLLEHDGRQFIVYANDKQTAVNTFAASGFNAVSGVREATDDPATEIIDVRPAPGA